jgi:hypothetical protein
MVDRNISQIVEDGVSGLFAAGTAEAFAEKINILLGDPGRAAAMGRAARERAGKLTVRGQVAKLSRLYEETVSRRLPMPQLRVEALDVTAPDSRTPETVVPNVAPAPEVPEVRAAA